MIDPDSYWLQLCKLVPQLRCWVHVAWKDGASTTEGPWGQMLISPVKGYLEASGGPIPIRDVDWVEVSTSRIKGGMAGLPLQFVDAKDDILAALKGTQLQWEARESSWAVEGLFSEMPVHVIRFENPRNPQ